MISYHNLKKRFLPKNSQLISSNNERLADCFPYKIKNKARISMLTASIQHCTRRMNNAVRKEKETKDISGKKLERNKHNCLYLQMTVYVENLM